MSNDHVLVVDDEPAICWGFEQLLIKEGLQVATASSVEEGLEFAKQHSICLVILDVRLPGEDGISALPKFRAATNEAPVVVMTAFGDLQTAVGAMQNGASDYLTKPFKLEDAARTCRSAMRKPEPESKAEGAGDLPVDSAMLVGSSPAMQQVFRQIALVADSDLSVLVSGETGTGKELVAAAIHRHSQRHENPYLAIAPVTLNESVLESELFGHVKGAFTGAADDRQGLFELADRGTVMLDEIGDLPMSAQVKLLRVIEQGEFTAVGDVRPRKCDVRIIAATNCNLQQMVAEKSFREDLLYRLAAVSINLPPLRNRKEDLPQLCEFFLRRVGYPSPATAISPVVMAELQQRHWWGNVRELRNAIEHASVVARGRALEQSDFPPEQPSRNSLVSGGSLNDAIGIWAEKELTDAGSEDDALPQKLYDRFQAATEPALFSAVLKYTDGNRAAAADVLGMHRGTLRDRLKKYDVS